MRLQSRAAAHAQCTPPAQERRTRLCAGPPRAVWQAARRATTMQYWCSVRWRRPIVTRCAVRVRAGRQGGARLYHAPRVVRGGAGRAGPGLRVLRTRGRGVPEGRVWRGERGSVRGRTRPAVGRARLRGVLCGQRGQQRRGAVGWTCLPSSTRTRRGGRSAGTMAGSDDIAEGRAAAPPGILLRASAPSACIPWHAALLSSSQRIKQMPETWPAGRRQRRQRCGTG